MDYKRIYTEFIKDRRGRENSLAGYFERHHIVPRSLGGSDEQANLISLSFEDHYFAHLLLACIYRGKMASALWMMVNSTSAAWSSRFRARKAYASAQRLASKVMSEAWSGDGNPRFNPTIFDWTNIRTGQRLRSTLHGMQILIGGNRPHWTNVAKGNRPSYRSWVLTAHAASHVRTEKGQSFTFVNRDGRRFIGTQAQFCRAHGLNAASASRIARLQSVSECGWRLEGTQDRPANYGKDGLAANTNRSRVRTVTLRGASA